MEIDEKMIPEIRHIIFRKCTKSWGIQDTLEGTNMTYIIEGEACYTVDGQTINVKKGDLLVLPKNSVRLAFTYPDQLMECFSVDFVLKNSKNRELPLPFPKKSSPGCYGDIIRLFHELSFSWLDKQPFYMMKCNGLLLQILYHFLGLVVYKNDSYLGDSRISKAVRYIAIHYAEHITARMMAERVGLNPTYFGALFRQVTGMSFKRYLAQTRVKNAQNMLLSGEYKVGDIAEACGFSDTSHFYRQFKLIKGYAPSHSLPKKF